MRLPARSCAAAAAYSRSSSAIARSEKALGEEQAGQHEMAGFPGVVGIVVRVEAAAACPVGGSREIALCQLQPSSLRWNGVEQAGWAHGVVLGFAHRVEGAHGVTARLADPRQRRQAGAQRRAVDELSAVADPLGDIAERRVEIVALISHLCEAHQRGSSTRWSRLACCGGELESLLAGFDGRVEAALGALDPGE